MHPNVGTIETLYAALRDADPGAAAACYGTDARFEDIAFRCEGRERIFDMWRFVCSRKIGVSFDSILADGETGSGHWVASYTFHDTGLPVVNNINSKFVFDPDGKIVSHTDHCSAMAWAIQAYDFPKCLLAGTIGPLRRSKARQKLDRFILETKSVGSRPLVTPT